MIHQHQEDSDGPQTIQVGHPATGAGRFQVHAGHAKGRSLM
jgi:hypothetical protein